MTPTELQDNFVACVLFYCFGQGDGVQYSTDLMTLGGILWNNNDQMMDPETWTREYPCPDLDTLGQPDLTEVLDWFNPKYVWAPGIKTAFESSLYQISARELEVTRFDESFTGMLCFNTTTRECQRFDGTSWVRAFQ